jgi:hypothetical protein
VACRGELEKRRVSLPTAKTPSHSERSEESAFAGLLPMV